MNVRRIIAIWVAKLISAVCQLLGKQGVTFAGRVALKLDPNILRDLAGQVREKIFVVCGTNGKTTTNNLLCSALEQEIVPDGTGRNRVNAGEAETVAGQTCINSGAEPGNSEIRAVGAGVNSGRNSDGAKGAASGHRAKVVCNHTGSNMLAGVAAAFVLAAKNNGKLDADYACIEIDEASTLRVFPHFKPDYMVLTNLFRDQLDRYGEIDITMDMLNRAMQMAPDMKIIVNADDALSAYLAMESGHEFVTFGISERVFSEEEQGEQHEIREGRFCKRCGERLDYEFYHYSQIGKYHCPKCGFARPSVDFDASHIDTTHGLAFDVTERAESEKSDEDSNTVNAVEDRKNREARNNKAARENEARHIYAKYRGFYNIYNILAAYAAGRTAGLGLESFEQVLNDFNPQNGRMEHFTIQGTDVILNLAKNPAGFNQNISAVMEDKKEKDIIIVINDNAQDGTDISWLWDVDFDRFGASGNQNHVKNIDITENTGDGKNGSIRSITVSGIRCQDMRLRMKYVDISCEMIGDVKSAIEARLKDGCGNLYVLVNYTALFSTRNILENL